MEPWFKPTITFLNTKYLSAILWWFLLTYKKENINSLTLEGPSTSLPSLLFHSRLPLCPHPLICIQCFSLTELLVSWLYIQLHTFEPLFLSLECFPFAFWQTPTYPSKTSSNVLYSLLYIPDFPVRLVAWFSVLLCIYFSCK